MKEEGTKQTKLIAMYASKRLGQSVIRLFSLLALGFASLYTAQAQCDRVGKVLSVTPDCGVKFVDLRSGQTFLAVNDLSDLSGAQVFSYKAQPLANPINCPAANGLNQVEFTCLSDTLPCSANFGYTAQDDNPLKIQFSAFLYDPQTQHCNWQLNGTNLDGATVDYTFDAPGAYSVCLKVTDDFGCIASKCRTIYVGQSNDCPLDIATTAIDKQLQGKLIIQPLLNISLNSIRWYRSQAAEAIAETIEFSEYVPTYGDYTVCAEYLLTLPGGNSCYGLTCKELTIAEEALCEVPQLAGTQPDFCTTIGTPVCGCNAITYANECYAIAAGIASWWEGSCTAINGISHAYMETKVIDGNLDDGFTVRFYNLADGEYAYLQLDFGDGSDLFEATQWDSIEHHYEAGGIYRSTLSVWKTAGFISSYTKLLVTDAQSLAPSLLPEGTDYVRPGDANGDQQANVYDLLNLGVGYYEAGAPRPFASLTWAPQYTPNWAKRVAGVVNYKHLDCDGNGLIVDSDALPILAHYSPVAADIVPCIEGAPKVWVEFEQDTIVIDGNIPGSLELKANIYVATPQQPVLNLYGLAFALQYPEYLDHDPEVLYDGDDFFGAPLQVLTLDKDNYDERQLDFGFVRKDKMNTGGYGRIAQLTFKSDNIIIVDIISREENKTAPLDMPVLGLRAIDAEGNLKTLTVPLIQDTVWIKVLETTGAGSLTLSERMVVSPNPADDFISLYTGDLAVSDIQVFNTLGQVVGRFLASGDRFTRFSVAGLAAGLYTVQVQTNEGVAEKKIVVR